MSLTKFLFFIKKRKLHLHNIDDFMDKEEGVLSALDKRSLPFYKDTEKWNKYVEDDRKKYYISCWISYSIEQSLMWYAYGKDGVAIRSTAGAIRQAMEIDKEHIIRMIKVRYIDKEKQLAQIVGEEINWNHFLVTKRKFFEMENEVRLLYYDEDGKCKDKGIDIDVSLEDLIKEIKVSSSLPEYVHKLICQEVEGSGIKIRPVRSEI